MSEPSSEKPKSPNSSSKAETTGSHSEHSSLPSSQEERISSENKRYATRQKVQTHSPSALVTTIVFVAAVVISLSYLISRPSQSAQLPKGRLQVLHKGWADETRCAECHEQADTFWESGHAHSLMPVTEKASIDLLKELDIFFKENQIPTSIEIVDDTVTAIHKKDGVTSKIEIDWCFGSGEHARTWVGTMTDSHGATDQVEFRWTWFHDIDDFAVTPGQPQTPGEGYFADLGVLFDPPKARKCFECHSSSLQVHSGKLDTETIKTNVTCQRCHGPRQAHVESEGEVRESFWKTATQMDSVNRCAECHRRAEEQPAKDIHKDNPNIARFQPVGLTQSPCFQGSQMTCLTCHNPHLSLKAQDSRGTWQCTQCHDGSETMHALCSAGHTSNCVQCHMPKMKMDNSPIKFTDHWIRIRRETDSTQ